MKLEQFLQECRRGKDSSEGQFTLAADRAKQLLKENALSDKWQSWKCLLQAFIRLGSPRLEIGLARHRVEIKPYFEKTYSQLDLFQDERFLLAWLNLDWFGSPNWDENKQAFSLDFEGAVWTRYRTSWLLKNFFRDNLRYTQPTIILNGAELKPERFSSVPKITLFAARSAGNALYVPRSGLQKQDRRLLESCEDDLEEHFAAVAHRYKSSWSQVTWVSHGVVVKTERNTLERPWLQVVASVQSLSLKTDLSGFDIVHDEGYFEFANEVKKQCLWML